MLEVNSHIIMEDELNIIKELKHQLFLNGVDVFHKIVTSGTNIQTTCPFHKDGQERKPSFGIATKDRGKVKAGMCHCFTCGWSGSIQEMISNCFGKNDFGIFGSKWLVKNFLTVQVENRKSIDLDYSRHESTSSIEYVSEEELDKYRVYHPYMWKRKLTEDVIDIFDIGFDKATNCITFPVRDLSGNTLFIARRSVVSKFFNYPENVDKPVYGLYEISQLKTPPKEIIVCESMLNATTCWVYGKVGVALNGTGTDSQYKQLRKCGCRKFISALDPDEAGFRGTRRLKAALRDRIVTTYQIPPNKDVNDLTKDEFDNLIEYF